jgi:hypothetical protein
MAIKTIASALGADSESSGVSLNGERPVLSVQGVLSGATVYLDIKHGSADWEPVHYESGVEWSATELTNDIQFSILKLESMIRVRTVGGDGSTSVDVEAIV